MPFNFNAVTNQNYDVCIKGIVIGESGTGKSSLMYRFTDNEWNPHYVATIGVDFKVLTFEKQSKVVKFQLWDTAGQERFRTITHSFYRGSHCIIMVYDVTNAESFEKLPSWLRDVKQYCAADVPIVLIGNKADMARHRQVSTAEGMQLAASLGCDFFETSAKEDIKVEDAFEQAVGNCLKFKVQQLQGVPNDRDKTVNLRGKSSQAVGGSSRCLCA